MTDETNGPGATDATDGPNHREDAVSPERVEQLARRLDAAGEPYVRVTVVRREPPVSAHVGDRAVLTSEGELVGWVGGAECAQSVVRREATRALATGEPVLVGLAPDPDTIARPGLESFPMTCHSGGTLELFVEPVRPAPRLVVVGDSPVARTLVRLAPELAYDVTAVTGSDPDATDDVGDEDAFADEDGVDVVRSADAEALAAAVEGAAAVVVATMGAFDDVALEAAVDADVPYVGLISSAARAEELLENVAARSDRDPSTVTDAVTVPAGIDIGAETPEEIAVSVLAEVVARHRAETSPQTAAASECDESPRPATAARNAEGDAGPSVDHDNDNDNGDHETHAPGSADETTDDTGAEKTVVDPVCGMTVVVGEAAATVEHDGVTYHFCGQGCADAFEVDPTRFTSRDAEAR